jgi:hypothetical protein
MTPGELRELISQAKARLAELPPVGKRWVLLLFRTRTVTDHLSIVVGAENADAALAATQSSQDRLNESDEWDSDDDEVTSFDIAGDPEECDFEPDYRAGEDGKLGEAE